MKENDMKKWRNRKNMIGIIAALILAILTIRLAFAIPDTLTLQGKLTNQNGAALASTKINFTFKIYDSFTGGNALYTKANSNVTTDANGIYDIILKGLSSLNFSEQYYLGITINEDNESEPRVNLTNAPYAFRANISERLNRENRYEVSVLNITGNLTLGESFDDALTITTGRLNISDGDIKAAGNLSLGEKIAFTFGQIIDNLVNGFLRISGNLNVTGNVTIAQNTLFVDNTSSRVGIRTNAPINALTVAGDVSAFGSLNATFINATEARQGLNQVQTVNAVFNIANYSSEYASTGFKLGNVTLYIQDNASIIRIGNFTDLFIKNYSDEYARSGFKIANYSAEYASIGFKRGNVTEYLGEDGNASLIRTVNISKDLAKSFSNFGLGNVSNYSQYARSADFNIGNISNNTLVKGDNLTLSLWNASGINIFLREISGSVGIGTLTPLQKLEVAGNILVNNTVNAFVNLSGPILRKSGNDIVITD